MALKVYGIKNCDTMKKTFTFLEEKGVAYDFIDYKKQKPTAALLTSFLEKTPLSTLVNKQGTTYKKMDEAQKVALENAETAFFILIENSSMIKRPVIVYPDGSISLGYVPDQIEGKI